MKVVTEAAPRRTRNRRGEGVLLADEILSAAAGVLEESGNEDAVSLRAVARRAGISAPAIYAHFADREALLEAIVDEAFEDLFTAVATAREESRRRGASATERLRAVCAAYVNFADERPGRFRILFGRQRTSPESGIPKADSVQTMIGGEAFSTLITGIEECVAAGESTSTDPLRDATALWVGLHGYATLRTTTPYFPWPTPDDMLHTLLSGAARVSELKP